MFSLGDTRTLCLNCRILFLSLVDIRDLSDRCNYQINKLRNYLLQLLSPVCLTLIYFYFITLSFLDHTLESIVRQTKG